MLSQSCTYTVQTPRLKLVRPATGRADVQARPSSPLLIHPQPPVDPDSPEEIQLQQHQHHHQQKQQQQQITGVQEWQVPDAIHDAEFAGGVAGVAEGADGGPLGPRDIFGGEPGADVLGDAAPDVACSNSHVAEVEAHSGKLLCDYHVLLCVRSLQHDCNA